MITPQGMEPFRSRNDNDWVMTLPLVNTPVAAKVCVMCTHELMRVVTCDIRGCGYKNKSTHTHCVEGCRCSVSGCLNRRRDNIHIPRGFH